VRKKKYCDKKGNKCESLDLKFKSKANKNIELENYKFLVGWIKNHIKKNVGAYF